MEILCIQPFIICLQKFFEGECINRKLSPPLIMRLEFRVQKLPKITADQNKTGLEGTAELLDAVIYCGRLLYFINDNDGIIGINEIRLKEPYADILEMPIKFFCIPCACYIFRHRD